MTLQFEFKQQYGNARYYPVNSTACAIVGLSERKTLSIEALQVLKAVGFTVVIEHDNGHTIVKETLT